MSHQQAQSSSKPRDAWAQLAAIMHSGLTSLSGRPSHSIVDVVLGDAPFGENISALPPNEAKLVKQWGAELDAWLVRHHGPTGRCYHETSAALTLNQAINRNGDLQKPT